MHSLLHLLCNRYKQRLKKEMCVNQLQKVLLQYAEGVSYAHKGNVDKHVKSNVLHDWTKKYSTGTLLLVLPLPQKKSKNVRRYCINSMKRDELQKTFCHCLTSERPLSDFEDLIELQQKNDLKFLQGKSHEKACAQFIDILAEKGYSVNSSTSFRLCNSIHRFSVFEYWYEKRASLHQMSYSWQSFELLLECIHADDYGGDTCDLKHAIDKVILTHYKIPKEKYIRLVCLL